MFHRTKIKPYERGLVFRDGQLVSVLGPGVHWYLDPLFRLKRQIVSTRNAWLDHADIEFLVKSGKLAGQAVTLALTDHERALVWIDGRFSGIVGPGHYAIWKDFEIRVEVVDARAMQLEHAELPTILRSSKAPVKLETLEVQPGHVAVWFRDGAYQATLAPGTYAFWKNVGTLKLVDVDLREQVLEISGQEIMTADKVTLRLNALVAYRVTDPLRWVAAVDSATRALYVAAQLALREAVGARDLDALLVGKESLGAELSVAMKARAEELGVALAATGVRDIILPGDMKELMNKVTEAKKAAEASLITRREETAAMRMQANTAKILESSPTLMKLKELEVLEKVAGKANLTVLLGEDGLASKMVKLV